MPWLTSWENTFGIRSRLKIRKAWSSETRMTTFGRGAGAPVGELGEPEACGDDRTGGAEPVQDAIKRTAAAGARSRGERIAAVYETGSGSEDVWVTGSSHQMGRV